MIFGKYYRYQNLEDWNNQAGSKTRYRHLQYQKEKRRLLLPKKQKDYPPRHQTHQIYLFQSLQIALQH